MNAKEGYHIRLEMSNMHEKFIERMSNAYDKKFYIESVWYCYSIFEQRINRLIAKYIDRCTLGNERTDDKSASISVRIKCLKKLIKANYGAFKKFDGDLLECVMILI